MKIGDLVQLRKEFRHSDALVPGKFGVVINLEKDFYWVPNIGGGTRAGRITVKWISDIITEEPEAALMRFPE